MAQPPALAEATATLPEAEGVDDNGVGDNSYEGTAGQACRAHLMDQLFNSPYSGAQCEAE